MSPWLACLLAFVGTTAIVGLVLRALTGGRRRVARRLAGMAKGPASGGRGAPAGEGSGRFAALASFLERTDRYGALEGMLARAGLSWRPQEFIAAWAAATAAMAAVGWLLLGLLGAMVAAGLSAVACIVALKMLEARRLSHIDRQLADALTFVASSLRAGYGVLRAIQAVRDEMPPPISQEFARVLDETSLGGPVPDALMRLVQRVPLPDLEIAVSAILIQLEVGGNLAESMETVSAMVRERQRVHAEVATLTAEGRLSGLILFILPITVAVVLTVVNGSYMSALFGTTAGHILIASAVVLQIIGGLMICRMLRLDF